MKITLRVIAINGGHREQAWASQGYRGRTSKRGMAWVKGLAPKSGLGGAPVGIAPYALLAKGLKPFFATSKPPAVMSPHFMSSRLLT
jgi:hypothetical protein